MIRLTLRSGRDGRFLARVVEQNGFPYVLDFGDERIIDDVSQRLQHGFTMWRFGRLVTCASQDKDLLLLLAEFYSGEGLLVFLDEPSWAGREANPEVSGQRTDPAGFALPDGLPDLGDEDPVTEWAEPETEIVDPSQLSSEVARALGLPDPELEALMEAPEPPPLPVSAHLGLPDLEFDDLLTEELPTLELDIEDEVFDGE